MIKRIFDVIASFFGLLLLCPLLLILALAIIIDSKGGVFYMQTRVGKNNVDFKLLKFRSMASGSDRHGLLTVGNDSRITKVGYYIRKFKFDEFAQLFNVIKGDMSLVGPRPEVRKYVDLYTDEQLKVLCVKPGITDIASLEYFEENALLGKSSNPEKTYVEDIMPHKLNLNLQYIKHNNIIVDIKLVFKTLFKVVS